METFDAIRARRNVRSFESRPVADADLDAILEAARRTPSARNKQRWDFVLCTDRAQLEALSGVWQGAGHVAGAAAAIALIAPIGQTPAEDGSIEYDLGQATMTIMLAAADRGIGTAHASVADQELAQSLLGFPDGLRCAYLLSVGYPADRPLKPINKPDRREFEDVVHRGTW
jgi:nitroreductase